MLRKKITGIIIIKVGLFFKGIMHPNILFCGSCGVKTFTSRKNGGYVTMEDVVRCRKCARAEGHYKKDSPIKEKIELPTGTTPSKFKF